MNCGPVRADGDVLAMALGLSEELYCLGVFSIIQT